MTVTYTAEVTTSTGLGNFLKLLARWRGSIYKIVWMDLLLFLAVYYTLNVSYLYFLDATSKTYFVKIVKYCAKHSDMIPLSFVLGFYVSLVYNRWWSQYTYIPYPDSVATLVGISIEGRDERARIVRRTIARYLCTTFTLALTMISPKVKKRFPTLKHFVDAGLLTKEEMRIFKDLDKDYPNYSKYWLPLAWCANIIKRSRHEGMIREDLAVKELMGELSEFRCKCRRLLDYDWISVPLVYTQVVTLAVYSYFILTVIGNQFIETNENPTETFFFSVPFMPIVQFFFYMGWLKVAESLLNPFGEDDDDFEVVWMIDRHLQVSYLLVDKIHEDHPKLQKDHYWDKKIPDFLPFTIASQKYMSELPKHSATECKVKKTEQDLIVAQSEDEVGMLHDVRLKTISVQNTSDGEESDDEVNEYVKEGPYKIIIPELNASSSREDLEEFEKLRRNRLEERRRKALKYVELFNSKTEKSEDIKKIIDDILK